MGVICSCLRGDIIEPREKTIVTPNKPYNNQIKDGDFNYRKFMDELI